MIYTYMIYIYIYIYDLYIYIWYIYIYIHIYICIRIHGYSMIFQRHSKTQGSLNPWVSILEYLGLGWFADNQPILGNSHRMVWWIKCFPIIHYRCAAQILRILQATKFGGYSTQFWQIPRTSSDCVTYDVDLGKF